MKNIIITGGGMVNKGAQAMTLIAVDELRRRFPEHKIYLYSPVDLENKKLDKEQFAFDFTGWYPLKFAACQNNILLRMVTLLRSRAELLEAEQIYRNTEFIVDISGYALGSNWSDKVCNDFLDILEFAAGFKIPVYLMPQSFGPFEFSAERRSLDDRINKLLASVKVIFAREQEGYDALVNRYGLTNVRLATDLVLANKGIDLKNVFKMVPQLHLPDVPEHSAAVIPNSMNAKASADEKAEDCYIKAIFELLALNKRVYIISHSSVDVELCKMLKEHFVDREDVVLLSQDFSCLEFNELVKQFDYLIASRFHSIVHAYKNAIPCIALGWATKYHDLLQLFGQERYVFDVRNEGCACNLVEAIKQMEYHFAEESARIRTGLAEVQKENVFDVLSLH